MAELLGSLEASEGNGTAPSGASSRLPGQAACPICKGMGFLVYDVPPGDPNFSRLVPCRCTEARQAMDRARALRSVSNLGQLQNMTFDTFRVEGAGGLSARACSSLEWAYRSCLEFAKEPRGWLVLWGGYGCGKTHLAAAIAGYRLELGHPAIFVVVPDLLDHLRSTYAPDSSISFDERFESIRETELLILDDLGAHNSTPWAEEKLFQLLNARYNGRLPTVITSNQPLSELEPRLLSRLSDPTVCRAIEILAPDFRVPGGSEIESGIAELSTLRLHRDQTFESFTAGSTELTAAHRENLKAALARARAYSETPTGWLVLTGTYGCGKTHLAAAIANYQLAKGRDVPMFVVVPDLLDHLRATFSPTSNTTLDKLFDQVRSVSLLILDDLGTESATPWAREKLFQLLNHRYAARLPTVITSTSNPNEMDPRLGSRMWDPTRCTVFAIQAPAYHGAGSQRGRKGGAHRPNS